MHESAALHGRKSATMLGSHFMHPEFACRIASSSSTRIH